MLNCGCRFLLSKRLKNQYNGVSRFYIEVWNAGLCEYHSISESKSAGLVVLSPLSKSSLSETRAESEVKVGEIVKANKNA